MDLSIVIPAYNEEKRILIALEQTLALMQQRPWSYELLVVDDGSADRTAACTAEYAREHPQVRCVQNDRNRGKGYSVQHGVAEAQGRYIGFMDGDYKTDIAALDQVMPLLAAGWDGVIGDRTLSATEFVVARRRYRQWGTEAFGWLLRALMGLGEFGDTQCGFKFFQAAVARDLCARQQVAGFMFDVELLLLARQLGYRIAKIPVKWRFDPDSRFKPGDWDTGESQGSGADPLGASPPVLNDQVLSSIWRISAARRPKHTVRKISWATGDSCRTGLLMKRPMAMRTTYTESTSYAWSLVAESPSRTVRTTCRMASTSASTFSSS